MTNYIADHYFSIGNAHLTSGKPCQDHAISRSNGAIACAIVSDGCSTGGNTDVGSRILTFSTLQAIREHAVATQGALETAVPSIVARQQQIIGTAKYTLGLERSDLLATCAYAYLTQNGGFIHIQGDGVIALKYLDGTIAMHRYDWEDNTPFYPSYMERDLETFIAKHGGDLEAHRLVRKSVSIGVNNELTTASDQPVSLKQGLSGVVYEISDSELRKLEFIAVFSDGVTQLGRLPSGGDTVSWVEAVKKFIAFKSATGEFAKRRMIRGIKDYQQAGFGPIDDISYAVVRAEQTVEGEESHNEHGAG